MLLPGLEKKTTRERKEMSAVVRSLVVFGLLAVAALPGSGIVQADHERDQRHVLLISVDGLHQSDLEQWTKAHPSSRLAQLARAGVEYTDARTTIPSDSFPGLMAQVTGGTSKSTGVFYDDSYDRTMWAPGSNCQGPAGAEAVYAENLDKTDASGNIPLFTSIDPKNLPMGMVNGTCQVIYPHSFLKVNTIFNVAHAAGLYTAWSDKHPAYEIVRGPENTGAEDLFTPEINNVNDPTAISVAATTTYDQLKVKAVLNEIDGMTSDAAHQALVPAIFGMNFQSVSVGEKLVDPVKSCSRNPTSTCDPTYFPGGYEPGSLAFTPQMELAMSYVDGAIGSMVDELRKQHLSDSTEVIISAKHGQAPIDPSKLNKIGDQVTNVLNAAHVGIAQNTSDDVALVWLKDQRQTRQAVAALNADKNGANTALVDFIYSGDRLVDLYGDPRTNARTPDLIVQPQLGTIYTTSKAKVAEHGGGTIDDTHVALLVVTPDKDGRRVGERVETRQIAPTILKFLGLNPRALESVREEHTQTLPGVEGGH
jgi:hypothetical protein